MVGVVSIKCVGVAYKPGDIRNGGCNLPAIISSTSKKGFSPYTNVYNVTPRDHISNSGPA